MATISIGELESDAVVLHFQTDGHSLNAYTLASLLVSLADAAKTANYAVNPGYDIEVVVEAIGPGSFRAKLRALAKSSQNLFSAETLKQIVVGVLVTYICMKIWPQDVSVTVNTDEVIVVHGNDRIIVPRVVYEGVQRAEKSPRFREAVDRTIDTIVNDDSIHGLGFVRSMNEPPPDLIMPRKYMESVAISPPLDPDERDVIEQCELDIVKAILERGQRKWEFMWRGIRISAPVSDNRFYSNFQAHTIRIAPGDQLKVNLRIRQRRDPATFIFTNVAYEVVEVLEHIPRVRQLPLHEEKDPKQ